MQKWRCPILKVISKINKNNDSFDGQCSYQPKHNGHSETNSGTNWSRIASIIKFRVQKFFRCCSGAISYSTIGSGITELENASNNSSIEQASIWYHDLYVVFAHDFESKF